MPGCVSSDQSLLISVLFHLIETHTHTHRTCGLWSPGVRRMDHFLYASFKLTAVFKRKSIYQGLPVEGCVGVGVQIRIPECRTLQHTWKYLSVSIFLTVSMHYLCSQHPGFIIACFFLSTYTCFDDGWRVTRSPPLLLSARRTDAFSSLLPTYERVVWLSTGKVITLLFSLSSITDSVKPNRQADRAVTGPLIWQLLHITKPSHQSGGREVLAVRDWRHFFALPFSLVSS